MKIRALLSLFLVTALFLSACGNSKGESSKETKDALDIYTTVYPLQYFTEAIGGEYVNVETIYPPGTDEHSFEPSQKDIVKMAESDLFFYIGYNLEGFVTKAEPILSKEGVSTIAVGETVHLDEDEQAHEEEHAHEEDGHDHGGVNPHLWLDPIYSIDMAKTIKDELTKKMPEQEEYFNSQFNKLSEKLTALDEKFATTIESGRTNKIIVSHSAYGYWEERYGLEQIGVTGLTSSNEPSQKELGKIVTMAEEEDLNYVIFEQNISSKLTEIIQKEMGAKSLELHNLSVLTDKDIEAGEDYFSLMEKNIKTLQTALQ
ncbi:MULTISPECIES: metal ABC transporter solute-binding protein, Zn/Mn family [Peribacillus]|uniref:metal ABC transporter solute-binding protein, Zn/Mn family n=1 Tax=Peribacillus TaxID=2675229 RepID=UPI00203F54AF|nr:MULTISPECIES: zinc ABC transporter substrate-binding protein [Peribacillus]MCM3677197.1 zinc ABC transporter substrate-binding protein [Peribacillus simplex]MDQ0881852.1 zinc transport system substrate-binding protein [Peribacillus sp. V2I11]